MLSNPERVSRPFGVFSYLRDAGFASVGAWARAVAEAGLVEPERASVSSPEPDLAQPPGTVRWGPEQLLSCDALGVTDACPAVIDVTGPARCLVFGPYLSLEPGQWRAAAVFDLCPEAARRRLIVQFGAMPEFTTKDVPRQPGRHRIEMDFEVKPQDQVEVRLLMTLAGFHGELRFAGAFLERLGDAG